MNQNSNKPKKQMTNREMQEKVMKGIDILIEKADKSKTGKKPASRLHVIVQFAIIASIVLGITVILFFIKKKDTTLVIQGDPQNITINNFEGDITFDTNQIVYYNGSITNREQMKFALNGEEYTADPGEFVVEFDAHNYAEKYDAVASASAMMTKNHSMNYSTTSNSEFRFITNEIIFNNSDSASAFFMDSIGLSSPDDDDLTIEVSNMVSDGILQLQSGEDIRFLGDLVVKYKNAVIANNTADVLLTNSCTFYISDQANIGIGMEKDRSGLALSGTINKISGKFHGDASLYSISRTSQNEFYCGNQEIDISGEGLSLEYVYGSSEQDMVVCGKPQRATLESVDVLEGLIQFMLSNYSSIIITIATGLVGVFYTKLSSDNQN